MKVMLFDKIRNNHMLLMILCCALPIAAVLSLSYLGVLGSWGYYALFLLCPLAHILMFKKSHAKQVREVVKKSSH
ncbi:MAG: hypothetical protein MUO88_13335 [Desulfobacterales bacterium]|jgi:hypothetical protein|nr:hypothetical protein [Desulfobacterales bacterium]